MNESCTAYSPFLNEPILDTFDKISTRLLNYPIIIQVASVGLELCSTTRPTVIFGYHQSFHKHALSYVRQDLHVYQHGKRRLAHRNAENHTSSQCILSIQECQHTRYSSRNTPFFDWCYCTTRVHLATNEQTRSIPNYA